MRDRIKFIRKHAGMTQAEFALALGLGPTSASAWEKKDAQIPTEPMQLLICKTFNVDKHWLKTGEGEPFNEPSEEEILEEILNRTNASPATRSFFAAWLQLDPPQRAVLEKFVVDYASTYQQRAADAATAEATHIAISRATEPEQPPEALQSTS